MKLNALIAYLEEIAPGWLQEGYDNSGLILGSKESELSKILVCLDADSDAIEHAIQSRCDAVLSHHPAIFKAIKTFTEDTREGALLLKAIRHNLALISCHTNFDSAAGGLTDLLCTRIGLKDVSVLMKQQSGENCGYGRIGNLDETSGKDFVDMLMSKLSLKYVRFVGKQPEKISTAAVFNGSYDRSILPELLKIRPDVLITGDLKYHDAQELKEKGIFTVDAGHYGTEKLFVDEMTRLLSARFPALTIERFEGADIFINYVQTTD